MDPAESAEIDPDMAAAMGFSSFGMQSSAKKRKYNHNDAVTGYVAQASGSGANATQIGKRASASFNSPSTEEEAMAIHSESTADTRAENNTKQKQANPTGLAQFLAHGQTLPGASSFVGAASSTQDGDPQDAPMKAFPTGVPKQFFDKLTWKELEALRKGVKGEDGDVAYFLPSFIEDPWAKLERGAEGSGS